MKSDVIKQQISDYVCDKTRICEMVVISRPEDQTCNVPIDPRINMSEITDGDSDPKFVNVEVIRSGCSGNNRIYTNDIIEEISGMIPGLQGFCGHPDPSKYGFEFRDPQCIYVGSVTESLQDGSERCIAKAYLFKDSKLREWLPKSIAAGNPMTVSINGSADVMQDGEYYHIIHMSELQSIDWANPGTEGINTSKAISIVSEMNKGGSNMADTTLNAGDIIKGITIAELRQHNPELINSIEEGSKITEMNFTINGKEETIKVTELQARFDAYEEKLSAIAKKAEKDRLDAYKAQKITEMVDEAHRELFSKRVNGNTEAEIDASINSEIEFVREMGGNMTNVPAPRNKEIPSEDIKQQMLKIFGVEESK